MQRDRVSKRLARAASRKSCRELFRRPVLAAFAEGDQGAVMAIAQPSAHIALLLAVAVVGLIAAALYVVEVPQRAPAAGILMPPDGMRTVTSPDAAMVSRIAVTEGQLVVAGQLLLQLAARRTGESGARLATEQRQSLQRELDFQLGIAARQASILRARRLVLQRRLAVLRNERDIAARDADARRIGMRLAGNRLRRIAALREKKLVSDAALEEQQALLLEAGSRLSECKSRLARLDGDIEALLAETAELDATDSLEDLQFQAERERLRRQLRSVAVEELQRIVAPFDASVARIGIRDGSYVTQGQALVTLVRPEQRLEAWLYVSSRNIGRMRPGQVVELRLDGWPHQIFGTARARVTSISASALRPEELSVPLAIAGPVFEIRATLASQTAQGLSRDWVLRPGTSFRADVIKARYRLYQWLGRSLGDLTDDNSV